MSFIRLKSFLEQAFSRIDNTNAHQYKLERDAVLAAVRGYITTSDLDYQHGTVVIYSASAALKQKVFLSKEKLLQRINSQLPTPVVRDIVFKGPR